MKGRWRGPLRPCAIFLEDPRQTYRALAGSQSISGCPSEQPVKANASGLGRREDCPPLSTGWQRLPSGPGIWWRAMLHDAMEAAGGTKTSVG